MTHMYWPLPGEDLCRIQGQNDKGQGHIRISNLPCLYSTFHLEYPLVLSRFYFVPFPHDNSIFLLKNMMKIHMCGDNNLRKSFIDFGTKGQGHT